MDYSPSLWADCPIRHIQDLEPQILGMASHLSKRGQDAFGALYAQCEERVPTLLRTLIDPLFSWIVCHDRLGEKTLSELAAFSSDVLALVEKYGAVPGLEDWDICKRKASLAKYGIPPESLEVLFQLEQSLGYFPVLALVGAWIDAREERDNYICCHAFDFWQDSRGEVLSDIAEHLGITAERTRQVRVALFRELTLFLQGLALDSPCHYDPLSLDLADTVSKAEGTSFNANFIRFILGGAFSSLTAVGRVEDSFVLKLKGGTDDAFVAAVPMSLSGTFDFNGYLMGLEALRAQKRVEPHREPLPEGPSGLKDCCAALAFLRYRWERDGDFLLLPPNEEKNRPGIMEDIIRDAGRPLTVDEILQEYKRRYPERKTDVRKIRGNMRLNPRIVPIGREGVYSLAEWTEGSIRGGTIRSFVRECLDASGNHIVPTKEVCEYVRTFRPTTSEQTIISNLKQESSKSFRILWKDGVSYLSYSSQEIPEGYTPYLRSQTVRRSFQESVDLVDAFISTHWRMPSLGGEPSEARLGRFLSTARRLRRRGLLSEEEMAELDRLETRLDGGVIQLELF